MTREEAIKVLERISEGTIQRDCSTCGRPTAGIYSGVCCYCSLCEVVPEILKDYHERKHFRSYWTWDGKRKNEALDMAISALRQQEHFREATKKVEPLTNAQKIRAMSDEELCDLLDEWWCMGANNDERLSYADERLAWLQQPYGEEDKHEPN